MSKNDKLKPEEQGDELDVSSFDGLEQPDSDEYDYEVLDGEEDENYDEFEEEDIEEKQTFMNNLGNSMNLTGKSKLVISGLLIGAVAVILIFNPFGNNSDTVEATSDVDDNEPNFFQKIFVSNNESSEGTAPEGEELLVTMMRELELDNPGYEIVSNEDGTITLTGTLDELPHIITYSSEGDLISEVHDGVELIDGATTPAFTTDPSQINKEGEETPPVDGAVIPNYEIPEDTVLIKKTEYDKSINSLSTQAITESFDENGEAYSEVTEDKFIVQYEKLPIKGRVPMLYSRVIETGEVIIFPVTLEQYMGIEDSGTTVIGAKLVTMHGVTSYDDIYLVDWKY